MKLPFSKYEGAGNDFILIDDRARIFPTQDAELISRLCSRQLGVGADGLIAVQKSSKADFCMRIFNADGYEASFCGNGLRCLVRYLEEIGISQKECKIETMHSVISASFIGDKVAIDFPPPKILDWEKTVEDRKFFVIDTGVPHAVHFVLDLASCKVEELGREIRFHSDFEPLGVNVNFITEEGQTLHIRTYERGVEGETLSCGSGAAASAFVVAMQRECFKPLLVVPHSKQVLEFSFTPSDEGVHMRMTGPARRVFSGVLELF